jgi:type II secretory pathway component PulJ
MKPRGGFTLLEAVIALGLWLILSAGVLFVLRFSAENSARILEQQNAFENARISMDALIMNFQMSRRVTIQRDGEIMRTLTFVQNSHANDGGIQFHYVAGEEILTIGQRNRSNEFSSGIAFVRIVYVNNRVEITVTTSCLTCDSGCQMACDGRITLEGSVCVKYKEIII